MLPQMRYQSGKMAETIVCDLYCEQGYKLSERRWRCAEGEIDLVFEDKAQYIFVEVKKARDFQSAAARISAKQIARISNAAQAFLAARRGSCDVEMRFDVALVDQIGRVEILKGAF